MGLIAKPFLTKLFQMILVFHIFNKRFIIKTLVTIKIVMKKLVHYSGLLMILFLLTGLFSCERLTELYRLKETTGNKLVKGPDKKGNDKTEDPCGEPVVIRLVSNENLSYSPANVTVTNDEEFLTVKFEVTENDREFDMMYLQVGPLDLVPLDDAGTYPAFWEFEYKLENISVTSQTFQISLAELDDCFVILAQARVTDGQNPMVTWTEGVNPDWTEGPFYTYYCVEICDGTATEKAPVTTSDTSHGGKDKNDDDKDDDEDDD